MMKVYLDFQIWDYITKNSQIKDFILAQQDWKYFLSVAHLEELYKAKRNESIDKKGLTDTLRHTMQEISENGIISPTINGLVFLPKHFDKSYDNILTYDTQPVVSERSLCRKEYDMSSYDPKDSFTGIKHSKDDEHMVVWKTPRVQNELNLLSQTTNQLLLELSQPNNKLRLDYEKTYGKVFADQLLYNLLLASKTEITPAIYRDLQNNYVSLEYVIEQLFFTLTKCGYKRDTSDKHAISGTYDIQHFICATLCDLFITNDTALAAKCKAICFYLAIPLKVKTWNEIYIEPK